MVGDVIEGGSLAGKLSSSPSSSSSSCNALSSAGLSGGFAGLDLSGGCLAIGSFLAIPHHDTERLRWKRSYAAASLAASVKNVQT